MSTYEPDDTKGNIGKIVGSIFGVPPILLAEDDDEDSADEGAQEPEASAGKDRFDA